MKTVDYLLPRIFITLKYLWITIITFLWISDWNLKNDIKNKTITETDLLILNNKNVWKTHTFLYINTSCRWQQKVFVLILIGVLTF